MVHTKSSTSRIEKQDEASLIPTTEKHDRKTQPKNTTEKHDRKTQPKNTTEKHNRKTQPKNTTEKHNRKTQPKNTTENRRCEACLTARGAR
jgi:hypothetical protein